jgi:adenine deaminase
MGALNKRRRAWLGAGHGAGLPSASAQAQDLLVRNATVHTASARSLQHADVLVQGGIIRAVGNGLSAPAGANVVEADGRPLTPALFGASPRSASKKSPVKRARSTAR